MHYINLLKTNTLLYIILFFFSLSPFSVTDCLIELSPDLCFIVEEESDEREEKLVAGYALAIVNAKDISSRTTSQQV